jgi:hypothetical protein
MHGHMKGKTKSTFIVVDNHTLHYLNQREPGNLKIQVYILSPNTFLHAQPHNITQPASSPYPPSFNYTTSIWFCLHS